ncbi:MAG: nucleotide exchange factor GrpE [Syntrophomonadaceae bacterium]|jgi:molecular chaperone GrpE
MASNNMQPDGTKPMEEVKENNNEKPTVEIDDAPEMELKKLKEELARCQQESQENYNQYLRAMADAENIKKRFIRERDEYIKFATLPLIKKLLPVIDDLDRAISMSQNSQDYEALYKGIEMIAKKLQETLSEEGVKQIEALNGPFDPQYHEPLTVEENQEYPDNTVIEELQKGYMMHGRVIRPSLVKVSKQS